MRCRSRPAASAHLGNVRRRIFRTGLTVAEISSIHLRRVGYQGDAGNAVARPAVAAPAPSCMHRLDPDPIGGIRQPTVPAKCVEVVHQKKIRRDDAPGYRDLRASIHTTHPGVLERRVFETISDQDRWSLTTPPRPASLAR